MKPATSAGGRTLYSLQYLRAGAALLVVYLHAAIQVNHLSSADSPALLQIGKCGVDVFFVLSGYVMWVSTAQKPMRVSEFIKRRLIRIVPLYWIVTLAAASVAYFLPHLLQSTKFEIRHFVASLLFIPWPNPVLAPDPTREITESLTPLITPGWTLNFEMFFYVLFSVALLVPKSRRAVGLAAIIGGVYIACRALSPVADVFKFYGSGLIFEFLAGSLSAAVFAARDKVVDLPVAIITGIIAVVALLVDEGAFPGLPRWLVLGVPALVVVWSAVQVEKNGRLRFVKLLDQLGNASYSIYVTHIFVVAGARIIPRAVGFEALVAGRLVFITVVMTSACVVGLMVHAAIEKPLIKLLNRGLLPTEWKLPRA